MRKWKPMFHIPYGEKVTENTLRRVLISSLVGIILCVNCLIGTTWAWYETSITSSENVIRVGDFTSRAVYQKGSGISTFGLSRSDDHEKKLEQVGYHKWTLTNTGTIEGYYTIYLSYEDKDEGWITESFTTETVYPQEEGGNQNNIIYLEIYISSDENHKLPIYVQIVPTWGENPNPPGDTMDTTIFEDEEEALPTEDETISTEPSTEPTEPSTKPETEPTEPPAEPETEPAEPPAESETEPAEPPAESETEPAEPPAESETEPTEPPAEPETEPTEPPAGPETEPTESTTETETVPTKPDAETNGGTDTVSNADSGAETVSDSSGEENTEVPENTKLLQNLGFAAELFCAENIRFCRKIFIST